LSTETTKIAIIVFAELLAEQVLLNLHYLPSTKRFFALGKAHYAKLYDNFTYPLIRYTNSGRYVYYVTNLRLEEPYNISPCSSGTSRWLRISGNCPSPTNLDSNTHGTISAALSSSSDTNPYVRDIFLTGSNCDASDLTIGAQIQAGNECFEHVHPDLYSVRDFTLWVEVHDGNQQAMAGGK
jgi:hypothetical protein